MSKFATVLKVAGVVAGVVVVGILLGWWSSRGTAPKPVQPVASTEPPSPVAPQPVSVPPRPIPEHVTGETPTPVAAVTASTNLITDWEDRLDQILGPPGDESDKAKQLLAMFPRLPEQGQVEVAHHLSNLTADADYAPLGQYLTNLTVSASVRDVLMQDLLNRPNSLKLPLLLEIARQDQNPEAGQARELLELYLEDNYGNDWAKWQEKLQQWLQDNPD